MFAYVPVALSVAAVQVPISHVDQLSAQVAEYFGTGYDLEHVFGFPHDRRKVERHHVLVLAQVLQHLVAAFLTEVVVAQ